jgi:hypothetical protein
MGTRPQGKQEPATAGRMGDQQGGPSQDSSNQSEGQSPAQQGPEGQSSRGKETPGSPSSSAAAGKPASGNAAGQEGDESNGPDSAKPSESGTSSRAPKPGVKESAAKQNDPSGRPTESSPSAAESPPKDTEPPAKNGGDATSPPGADPRTASGGNVGVRPPARNGDSNDVASGDEPNLEYARRVTDLVLEYLRDQRDRPDRRLLNDLGWTAEDMRRFLDRWQQLRKSAQEDPAAQNEWEESLRSLGLRPVQDRVRRASGSQDDLRGLRESGLRSAPPLQYQDQLEAFKKGTARQER